MKKRSTKRLRLLARMISMMLIVVMLSEELLGSGSIVLAAPQQEEESVTEDPAGEDGSEILDTPAEDAAEEAVSDENAEEEPQILFEVEELRDQNSKQYRLSDGTILAAAYGMDVHYEDGNGNWQDIDNRFLYEPASALDAMEGFVTAEGAVEFKFAPDAATGEVVRTTNGEYSVGFELLSKNTVEPEVAENSVIEDSTSEEAAEAEEISVTEENTEVEEISVTEEITEMEENIDVSASPIKIIKGEILNSQEAVASVPALLSEEMSLFSEIDSMAEEETKWARDWEINEVLTEDALMEQMTLDHTVTSVGYEDVFPGTSLQYITSGSSLKEYILVKEKQDSYVYVFAMHLENLLPQMQEDNSILLKDREDGTVVYEIPAAYMTDAAGEYSDAVEMELTEVQNGIWYLTVSADAQWINEQERVFPVQIDPTLNNSLAVNDNNVWGCYVCSGDTDYKSVGYGSMFVGYDSAGQGKYIDYFQLKNLPVIPKNSVICSSSFYIYCKDYSDNGLSKINVGLKEINGASWDAQYDWDNKPDTETTVLDHRALTSDNVDDYVNWDITELVKKHYGSNSSENSVLGFSLEAYESMKNTSSAKVTLALIKSNAKPVLQIQYRDTKGVEDYFTYQTHEIGNAGTAYISDFTSQMTLAGPAVAYESTVMSYSLGLVYNSSFADIYFSNDADNGQELYTKDYSAMYIAGGWKLTAQETVVETTVTDQYGTKNYLVYNDSDGTEHYFHQSGTNSSVYEDEDGLGLTIKKSSSNYTIYTMTDKKDNKKIFTAGYLTEIEDATGNKIYIVYNGRSYDDPERINAEGNRIGTIVAKPKDGSAVTIFQLHYDSSGHLFEIENKFGGKIHLTYAKNSADKYQITEVRHTNLSTGAYLLDTKYVYDTDNHRMTHIYDVETKNGVQYFYQPSATGYRICGFHGYYAEDIESSQQVSSRAILTSDDLRQTVYTDAGGDGTFYTSDDIVTKYLFNSCGQTVNAMSEDAEGNLLGVTAAAYTENSDMSNTNNRVTGRISSGSAGQNLFSNGGFELPVKGTNGTYSTTADEWSHAGTGSVARRIESDAYGKNHSGVMHYNLYNSTTSKSSWIYRRMALEAGKTYTFSAYVNTSLSGTIADGGGVYLTVKTTDGFEIARSPLLTYRTDASSNDGWQRISTTFTAQPASVDIGLHWEKAAGTIWVDDLQLEEGSSVSRYNYVHNGSFEADDSREGWTASGDQALGTALEQKQGSNSLRMTGEPGSSVYAEQTIYLNKSSDTTFLLSGWSKGDSVPELAAEIDANTDTSLKYWGMTLALYYKDVTEPEYHNLSFAEYVRDWQYSSASIVPEKANMTIEKAVLRLYYQNNANTAYFDGISLTEEPAQTYRYDANGNLESVASNGNGTEEYDYDPATEDLIEVATAGSGIYTYDYNDAHLLSSVTNDSVRMEYTYDDKGQNTLATLTDSAGTVKMTSSAVYDQKGLLTSVTDNTGATASYLYDSKRRVMEETAPNGLVTSTVYEENWNRPGQVFHSGLISLNYTYEDGNLTQITRGGYPPSDSSKVTQYYYLDYDIFGNPSGAAVGSKQLAEYTYDFESGNLKYMGYGESGAIANIEYAYDNLDRLVSATYYDNSEKSKVYGYLYTSDGSLSGITENGKLVYTYDYDTLGRLIHSSAVEDDEIVFYTDHQYDTSNRIVSQKWQMGDESYSESYVYNGADGTLDHMTMGTEGIYFGYDSLKRLDWRESKGLKMEYTYLGKEDTDGNVVAGETTARVGSITYSRQDGTALPFPTLSYEYDVMGNITEITPTGGTSGMADHTTYTYDAQGQLTSEVRGTVTTTYTYDTYGNIRKAVKKSGSTTVAQYEYIYTNASWRDQLSQLIYTDGSGNRTVKSLTYDAIGNPTSYFNGDVQWSFVWEYGRQLASASNGTDQISYTYDVDGIRKAKTVNGVEHKYVTLNGKVVRETYGNVVIDYRYDNAGQPYKIIINEGGTIYYGYYVLNQQGDVIGILDENGNLMLSYRYNAWGIQTGAVAVENTNGVKYYDYNALKYRGYYYDVETGFYYLQSRYYDPVIGRFINADGYVSTGQDFLGYNMFAYCGNNPVNRVDYTGQFWSEIWEFAKTAVSEIGKAMELMSPAYAGCGGAAVVDGPLPFGDVVAVTGAALLTVGAIGYGIYQAAQAPAISIPKVEEKSETIVVPKEPDSPVIFPVDPNTFNPVGLVKVPRAGTKNGAIISWMDLLTNTEVFRWDENPNYSNGPHYHIYGTGHYYPGMIVPEPYATIYFPFR